MALARRRRMNFIDRISLSLVQGDQSLWALGEEHLVAEPLRGAPGE